LCRRGLVRDQPQPGLKRLSSAARLAQQRAGGRSARRDRIGTCSARSPPGQFPAAPAQVLGGQGAGEFAERGQQVAGQRRR
jgi:hypothetical protein